MKKIVEIKSKETFTISPTKAGENNLPCPSCSELHPKNSNRKCFSWNNSKGTGFCHRCDASFVEYSENRQQKTVFVVPEFDNTTEVSDAHLKWLESRMISTEAIQKAKISSKMEFMPQLQKEVPVLAFPFYRGGKLINVKYRGPQKSFKLTKGAELTFFNWDLAKESPMIVIVEGEIDALSYLTCGINFVISVPNGASKNLDYLEHCMDRIDEKECVILAVDQDPKGVILRDELARRVGVEKCKIVDFKDCKDANEFLKKYGAPALFQTLEDARDYPVSGVFAPKDFEDRIYNLWLNGLQPGCKIGLSSLDDRITWEPGRLAVVTGVPSHGKSEFIDLIAVKLNLYHGWKCAYFSPENDPLELHFTKIAEKLLGKPFRSQDNSTEEYEQVLRYVGANFSFIAPEDDYTLDNILAKAKYLVARKGIKTLVIDPFNKIDHQFSNTETQYISAFLDKLTTFAKLNKLLIFLIAHPVKMPKEGKEFQVPSLYSISGSANFYNKADYGLTVYRKMGENELSNEIEIHVQKVRYKHLGKPGIVDLIYNYRNGRYEELGVGGIDQWDNSNWLSDEPSGTQPEGPQTIRKESSRNQMVKNKITDECAVPF